MHKDNPIAAVSPDADNDDDDVVCQPCAPTSVLGMGWVPASATGDAVDNAPAPRPKARSTPPSRVGSLKKKAKGLVRILAFFG